MFALKVAAEEEDKKSKEIWQLAHDNLNTFKEKYPRRSARWAEVFRDIAAQENTEQAIVHYKQVVFGSEEGPITEDYNHRLCSWSGALTEYQRLKRHIRQKRALRKICSAHPEGTSLGTSWNCSIAWTDGRPRRCLLTTIQEHGNNRNGLGWWHSTEVPWEILQLFWSFQRYLQFLNKLETDPAFRQRLCQIVIISSKRCANIPKWIKKSGKVFLWCGLQTGTASDTAPMKATRRLQESARRATSKPPEETFTQLCGNLWPMDETLWSTDWWCSLTTSTKKKPA